MDGNDYKYIHVTGFQHPCWNDAYLKTITGLSKEIILQ
jgi:hypothetical protein